MRGDYFIDRLPLSRVMNTQTFFTYKALYITRIYRVTQILTHNREIEFGASKFKSPFEIYTLDSYFHILYPAKNPVA